jgi:hypothetical protein
MELDHSSLTADRGNSTASGVDVMSFSDYMAARRQRTRWTAAYTALIWGPAGLAV